jgi:hypothetical protein
MTSIVDVFAYDKQGKLALIVEAKGRTHTSSDWAIKMRRNILAHGLMPFSQYFMLALPDKLYLWKNIDNNIDLIEPTYETNSEPLFHGYFKKANLNPEDIGGRSFELIVTSWINELVNLGIADELPLEQRKLLVDSGLVAALKGGSIAIEQRI